MKLDIKTKTHGQKFYPKVEAKEFSSRLEIPSGRDPLQNAWLTITLNYSLSFLDSKNPGGLVYQHKGGAGGAYVRDTDKKEFAVLEWDKNSREEFLNRFLQTETFWNHKFLLITPRNYDGLDFTTFSSLGWLIRPNVLCLFRLRAGGKPIHLPLKAVRPDPAIWDKISGTQFRSNNRLYDDADTARTMRHEIGHALDQLHIGALLGDKHCLVHINDKKCYDTPKNQPPNIMGRGNALSTVNAKPWLDLIAEHTETLKTKWLVTMAVHTPPRRMPLGLANMVKSPEF